MRRLKFRYWMDYNKCFNYFELKTNMIWPHPSFAEGAKEWQQFTGLLDRKGVEIWEGDVLKLSRYWADHFSQDKSNVWFDQGAFRLQHCLAQETAYQLAVVGSESEVLGNVHENPELLK